MCKSFTKTNYKKILFIINKLYLDKNNLCVFDFDQTLYKHNSGHELLRLIISESRHPLIASLSRVVERLLYKFRFPVNVEAFIAKFFAPNLKLDSQIFMYYSDKILYNIENRKELIENAYILFRELVESNACKRIVILSNTPVDISKLSICSEPKVSCVSRYSAAIDSGILFLHDLYKFYINKKELIDKLLEDNFFPLIVVSDNIEDLHDKFKINVLVRDKELYICEA